MVTITATIFSLSLVPGTGLALCVAPFSPHKSPKKVFGSIIPVLQRGKVSLRKVLCPRLHSMEVAKLEFQGALSPESRLLTPVPRCPWPSSEELFS